MLNKAFILLCLMLAFFCMKELSNHKVFDNKAICLALDVNEGPEDDTDAEEDFNCSGMHQTLFCFYTPASTITLCQRGHIAAIKHPYAEIQSPPPQMN